MCLCRNNHRFIRERAYFLWEAAGRPDGRDQYFWFKAEREVNRELMGCIELDDSVFEAQDSFVNWHLLTASPLI